MSFVLSKLHYWGPGCLSCGLQNCPTSGRLRLTVGAMLPATTGLWLIPVAGQWPGAVFIDSRFPETGFPNLIGRQQKRHALPAMPLLSTAAIGCRQRRAWDKPVPLPWASVLPVAIQWQSSVPPMYTGMPLEKCQCASNGLPVVFQYGN